MTISNTYVRLCTVDLAETLGLLRNAFENRHRRSIIAGQEVNTKSLRLQTFVYKGVICAHCGVKATHFALERSAAMPADSRYHLNLWGIDSAGEDVRFTHDHIVPLARNGPNTLENAQPMCGPCNWAKKSQLESELEPRLAGRYLSCEGNTNPDGPGFYCVSSTTCRSATPDFLEFDGQSWLGLAEFKEENGDGEVRWLEGSKPLPAKPAFFNPFAPQS